MFLHSGLVWITLWGQSHTCPHHMSHVAMFDSTGHLLLRVEHHVATRHGGGVDLALVEDVAVVWVT